MQDDITAIAEWAAVFSSKTKLVSTVTRHYLRHKGEVTSDIDQLRTDLSAEDYFMVGEDIAALSNILIGPIQ